MSEEKITSGDVRAALKLRYEPSSHALLYEVANETGMGTRRYADAVAVGLWPSHGHEIEGIEIKVSRADWLRERADASKSQAIFQFCHRWWLACPKGMVAAEELPPTWGLLELVGHTMRVRVKAPKLKPVPPTSGFLASIARRQAGNDDETSRAIVAREVEKAKRELQARFDRQVTDRVSHEQQQALDAIALLDQIKDATGVDLRGHRPTATWIAAIRFAVSDRWGVALSAEYLKTLRSNLVELVATIDGGPKVDEP